MRKTTEQTKLLILFVAFILFQAVQLLRTQLEYKQTFGIYAFKNKCMYSINECTWHLLKLFACMQYIKKSLIWGGEGVFPWIKDMDTDNALSSYKI